MDGEREMGMQHALVIGLVVMVAGCATDTDTDEHLPPEFQCGLEHAAATISSPADGATVATDFDSQLTFTGTDDVPIILLIAPSSPTSPTSPVGDDEAQPDGSIITHWADLEPSTTYQLDVFWQCESIYSRGKYMHYGDTSVSITSGPE